MATGRGPAGETSFSEEQEEDEVVRRKPVRERAMSSITKLLIQGASLAILLVYLTFLFDRNSRVWNQG